MRSLDPEKHGGCEEPCWDTEEFLGETKDRIMKELGTECSDGTVIGNQEREREREGGVGPAWFCGCGCRVVISAHVYVVSSAMVLGHSCLTQLRNSSKTSVPVGHKHGRKKGD